MVFLLLSSTTIVVSAKDLTTKYRVRYIHSITNKSSSSVAKIRVSVAAPGNLDSQKITNLKPEGNGKSALTIKRDQYGQTVYIFEVNKIEPGQTFNFGYSCTAKFKKLPGANSLFTQITNSPPPQRLKQTYTRDIKRIYDLNHPSIQKLAKQFSRMYPKAGDRVLAIHQYVASNLKYKREGTWDSAPQVIARRNGSCSEFSYLFSALCRATGIPTRFAGGSRMRKNPPYIDKSGHRWVEVYFSGPGWVPFDPTLASKTSNKLRYAGTFYQPSLIVLHGGGGSELLGNAYRSTNSKSSKLKRSRRFFWYRSK